MKNLIFIFLLVPFCITISYAQSIGINQSGTPPDPSALLDVNSTTKGVLITRMTTTQRNAITLPAAGLLVFDLDKSTIYLFDGQKWQPMLFANSDINNPPISRSTSDGSASDKFGISVSISGDYAIIGAYLDDIGSNTDQGSAYIFTRQNGGWAEQAKLIASDGTAGDNFGTSVSIDGDYVIVGSPKGSGSWFLQGAAYIFIRNGSSWVQQAKLNSSDGVIGESFGTSVCINGDNAIIGNPTATVLYANQGAAYIFLRSGTIWSQQAKLTFANGQYNDHFGSSVGISEASAIVGAPDFDWFNPNQGAAFIFVRTGSTWTQQDRLMPVDGAQDDNFGASVTINIDNALIGAPNDDGVFANQGCAYIFARNGATWTQKIKLIPANTQLNANFGSSVNIFGDYAIVGAPYEDNLSSTYHTKEGVIYIYHYTATGWDLLRSVKDGSGQSSGFFGTSVAGSGYNYIIGSAGKNNSKGEVSYLNIE